MPLHLRDEVDILCLDNGEKNCIVAICLPAFEKQEWKWIIHADFHPMNIETVGMDSIILLKRIKP